MLMRRSPHQPWGNPVTRALTSWNDSFFPARVGIAILWNACWFSLFKSSLGDTNVSQGFYSMMQDKGERKATQESKGRGTQREEIGRGKGERGQRGKQDYRRWRWSKKGPELVRTDRGKLGTLSHMLWIYRGRKIGLTSKLEQCSLFK